MFIKKHYRKWVWWDTFSEQVQNRGNIGSALRRGKTAAEAFSITR